MSDHIQQVVAHFGGAVKVAGSKVTVTDPAKLRTEATDKLAWDAVFGDEETRDAARWLLWELGQAMGCRPASIQGLYLARGRGECGGFTVPAINIRMMAYDSARAVLRAAIAAKAGAI